MDLYNLIRSNIELTNRLARRESKQDIPYLFGRPLSDIARVLEPMNLKVECCDGSYFLHVNNVQEAETFSSEVAALSYVLENILGHNIEGIRYE
jgi:hypothetical protein